MKNLKDIFAHIDLYGTQVMIEALKKDFTHVSFTSNGLTIPKPGSNTLKVERINPKEGTNVTKLICHKNGRVTIGTTTPEDDRTQFYQFLNL